MYSINNCNSCLHVTSFLEVTEFFQYALRVLGRCVEILVNINEQQSKKVSQNLKAFTELQFAEL